LFDEVELFLRIKDIHFDGQRPAEDIEEGAKEFLTQLGFTGAQGRGGFNELFLVPVNLNLETGIPKFRFFQQAFLSLQAFVVKDEQAAVFQVRRGHTPTALEITIEVVVYDAAKGVVGGVLGRAAHFRVGGVFVEPKLHGLEEGAGKFAVTESGAALFLGGLVKRRPEQGYLSEVVEVTGLKRSILPIVGETEELASFGL